MSSSFQYAIALDGMEVVEEFREFVRPVHQPTLSAFCRELTSIRQADVDGASTFTEVLANHEAWLDGHRLAEANALFITCGDWDLGALWPEQCRASVPPIEAQRPIYTRRLNVKRRYGALVSMGAVAEPTVELPPGSSRLRRRK